jgi:hypothetical protein
MIVFLIVLLICYGFGMTVLWRMECFKGKLMGDALMYRSMPRNVVRWGKTETQMHRSIDVKLAERAGPQQRMPYQFQYHEPLPMQGFTPLQNKSIIPARRRAQLKRVSGG